MTISVVIATYNRAALLRDCLAQLKTQAFLPGDEVVVADNASTDETPQVIESAAREFPVPLRYVHETAPGKSPALIAGIGASHGEVIALTDDDVLVAPDWIATVRRLFANPMLSLVGGRVDPRWERPAPSWLMQPDREPYGRMMSPLALLHYGDPQDLGARTAVGANMSVRRSVVDAVGGFAPNLGRFRGTLLCGEDHDFCQRVQAAGFRCEYRPELRVQHWVPAERVTVGYYLRWFLWSGVTNAMLDGASTGILYVLKRLTLAAADAALFLLVANRAVAAERSMDAAFWMGYLWQAVKMRRQEFGVRRQQAPQLPASTQTPAIPIPDRNAGNL